MMEAPNTTYVLLITWRKILKPTFMPATHEDFESSVEFTTRPAAVSNDVKRLEGRANNLQRAFKATFYDYQIAEVPVI